MVWDRTNPAPPDDDDARAVFNEALRLINEYTLHNDGVTYMLQGYVTLGGEVPAFKIDEHLLVKRLYADAAQARRKKGKKR